MNIIHALISDGIAQNVWQATYIANGLKLYELKTDAERLARARLYRNWRNSKALKTTRECYEKAIAGYPAPQALFDEALHSATKSKIGVTTPDIAQDE